MPLERDFTVGERAIILIGARADVDLDAINSVLEAEAGKVGLPKRSLPQASYDYLRKGSYKEYFDLTAENLWTYIQHPPSQAQAQALVDAARTT